LVTKSGAIVAGAARVVGVPFVVGDSSGMVGPCADLGCRVVALDEHASTRSQETESGARLATSNVRAPEVMCAA
jgi:hypothetical protein